LRLKGYPIRQSGQAFLSPHFHRVLVCGTVRNLCVSSALNRISNAQVVDKFVTVFKGLIGKNAGL